MIKGGGVTDQNSTQLTQHIGYCGGPHLFCIVQGKKKKKFSSLQGYISQRDRDRQTDRQTDRQSQFLVIPASTTEFDERSPFQG